MKEREGNMDVLEELREAGDVGTAGERLEELSRHGEREVRRVVAGNGNTPWETLEKLVWEFPREVMENPVGMLQLIGRSEEVFRWCIDSSDYEKVADRMLCEEDVPEMWVQWFRQHEGFAQCNSVQMYVKVAGEIVDWEQGWSDWRVRMMLARCERTPEKLLRELAKDEHRYVRFQVAMNRSVPGDVLGLLAKEGDVHTRIEIARREHIPYEVAMLLVRDEDAVVRCNAACNRVLPEDVLMGLVNDESELVRSRLAAKSEVSDEVLRMLVSDASARIRCSVANNARISGELLSVLLNDSESFVREAARVVSARRGEMGEERLREWAGDTSDRVRGAVAGNRCTPEEVLRILAKDQEKWIRFAVARNEGASEDVLRVLAEDVDPSIRRSVTLHVHMPLAELERLEQDENEDVRSAARSMCVLRKDPVMSHVDLRPYHLDTGPRERDVMRYVDWMESLDCSEELGEALLSLLRLPDGYDYHLFELLQWVRLPEFVLRRYGVKGACWQNRWLVAVHPRVPEDVRERLKRDGNRAVRAAARGGWEARGPGSVNASLTG